MRPSSMHYFPLAWPFLLALGIFLALLIVLIELRLLRYAYEKIGLSRRAAGMVLILTLLGSYVNIPIMELPPEQVISDQVVEVSGIDGVFLSGILAVLLTPLSARVRG